MKYTLLTSLNCFLKKAALNIAGPLLYKVKRPCVLDNKASVTDYKPFVSDDAPQRRDLQLY